MFVVGGGGGGGVVGLDYFLRIKMLSNRCHSFDVVSITTLAPQCTFSLCTYCCYLLLCYWNGHHEAVSSMQGDICRCQSDLFVFDLGGTRTEARFCWFCMNFGQSK